ncbi:hypothetical protein GGR50DRAFT_113675 [Xylaria sp. CBS 124048]|nr:hypothetical protein GGR50DRAFT_113675 [Xylaria sp. CBS 124048]
MLRHYSNNIQPRTQPRLTVETDASDSAGYRANKPLPPIPSKSAFLPLTHTSEPPREPPLRDPNSVKSSLNTTIGSTTTRAALTSPELAGRSISASPQQQDTPQSNLRLSEVEHPELVPQPLRIRRQLGTNLNLSDFEYPELVPDPLRVLCKGEHSDSQAEQGDAMSSKDQKKNGSAIPKPTGKPVTPAAADASFMDRRQSGRMSTIPKPTDKSVVPAGTDTPMDRRQSVRMSMDGTSGASGAAGGTGDRRASQRLSKQFTSKSSDQNPSQAIDSIPDEELQFETEEQRKVEADIMKILDRWSSQMGTVAPPQPPPSVPLPAPPTPETRRRSRLLAAARAEAETETQTEAKSTTSDATSSPAAPA